MHISVVFIGGLLGFASGLYAWLGLDIGLLAALAIWAASGPVTLLGLAAVYVLRAEPMPDSAHPSRPETA